MKMMLPLKRECVWHFCTLSPKVPEVLQSRTTPIPDVEDPLDEHLVNEINDYLQGIMEDKGTLIEMSDSPIKSQGAECVAAAVCFCE